MKLTISTTNRETLLGTAYLLFSLFVLPYIFDILNCLLPRRMTHTEINLLFFSLNFLCVTVIFRRFLKKSIVAAVKKPLRCLLWIGLGLLVYYPLTHLMNLGIRHLTPTFQNANNNTVIQLTRSNTVLMFLGIGVLVPIYEELLYRGLVFQGMRKKSRWQAYCVSMLLFAAIHVMDYLAYYDWLQLALAFAQYLPAGAIFAYVYERTDTIVSPIIMHIFINQISLLVSR